MHKQGAANGAAKLLPGKKNAGANQKQRLTDYGDLPAT
jgi:hypothetical protein